MKNETKALMSSRTMRIALKLLAPFMLWVTLDSAAQQPPPIDRVELTAAKNVFLMEDGVPAGHENASYEIFRATLDSTKRFNLLPNTHGADLILLFTQIPGRTLPPIQAPLLGLAAASAKSLALLGAIEVPWAIMPSLPKDQEAVSKLINALFALDGNGSVPAFTVATVPVNSLTEHLTTPLSILGAIFHGGLPSEVQKAIAGAHTVIFLDDAIPSVLPVEYQQTSTAFKADFAAKSKLHIVLTLQEADLVVHIGGYGFTSDNLPYNYITASAFTAATLAPAFSVEEDAKQGKTKKGKPSPFDVSVGKLEDKFEKSFEKIQREAVKP